MVIKIFFFKSILFSSYGGYREGKKHDNFLPQYNHAPHGPQNYAFGPGLWQPPGHLNFQGQCYQGMPVHQGQSLPGYPGQGQGYMQCPGTPPDQRTMTPPSHRQNSRPKTPRGGGQQQGERGTSSTIYIRIHIEKIVNG